MNHLPDNFGVFDLLMKDIKPVVHLPAQANLLLAHYLSEHLLDDKQNLTAIFPPALLQEIGSRTVVETVWLDQKNFEASLSVFGGRILGAILNLLYQYSGASARFAIDDEGAMLLTNIANSHFTNAAPRFPPELEETNIEIESLPN